MLSMVPVAEATLHSNTDAINTVKYTTRWNASPTLKADQGSISRITLVTRRTRGARADVFLTVPV